MKEYDIEKFYTVTQDEIEQNFDEIFAKVENGLSPIRILGKDGNDALLFSWEDYMERFGVLYTPEEIAAIEEACRNYREEGAEDGQE